LRRDIVRLWAAVLCSVGGSICAAAEQKASYSQATANFAGAGNPGDWTSQARDYANTRYSPLDQINATNVANLRLAWSFSDGTQYGHEGAPLVVENTMYLVTPFPNIAYALDLTKPSPSVKWSFHPNPSPLAVGKACCDAVLRGWARADGKLIFSPRSMRLPTSISPPTWGSFCCSCSSQRPFWRFPTLISFSFAFCRCQCAGPWARRSAASPA
jgi:glucose dehydrogenase